MCAIVHDCAYMNANVSHKTNFTQNQLSCVVLTNFLHISHEKFYMHLFVDVLIRLLSLPSLTTQWSMLYCMVIFSTGPFHLESTIHTDKVHNDQKKREFFNEIIYLSFARTTFHFCHLPMACVCVCACVFLCVTWMNILFGSIAFCWNSILFLLLLLLSLMQMCARWTYVSTQKQFLRNKIACVMMLRVVVFIELLRDFSTDVMINWDSTNLLWYEQWAVRIEHHTLANYIGPGQLTLNNNN